uniref:RNA-directed DNA polymerase n=1 Tax=Trichuris muris TaxID=70415 RepID=A0A5S6R6A2_TRIMR
MPNISPELRAVLAQQQQQLDQQQQQFHALLQSFEKAFCLTPSHQQPSLDALAASVAEFAYDPDNGITFEAWFKRFEGIFTVDCAALEDKAKVRFLLRKLTTDVHDKYCSFILPKKPDDFSFDEAVTSLKELFKLQVSLFSKRYSCLKLVKREVDDFVTYAGTVNRACEDFQFGSLTVDQFKCLIFICGLQAPHDSELRLRLLNKLESDPGISIQKLTDECNWFIRLRQDSKLVESTGATSEHALSIGALSAAKNKRVTWQKPLCRFGTARPAETKQPRSPCWLCGAMHFVRFCPYRNHTCSECGKRGHKEGYYKCRVRYNATSSLQTGKWKPKKKYKANGVHAVAGKHISCFQKYASILVNGQSVHFRIDTGSDLTLLSKTTWERLGCLALRPASVEARDVSNNPINFLGELSCTFSFNELSVQATCFIMQTNTSNLLGVELIEKLGMYKYPMDTEHGVTNVPLPSKNVKGHVEVANQNLMIADVLKSHPQICSDRLGLCTQAKATLLLKPGARPVFRPKRPVPYAALSDVERELDRLETNGVISKVNHSYWAAPIVVVKKRNGSFRICADFSTGLNDALELHQYPLPLPEDVFTVLNGGTVFSRIDFADAYLQIEVDEQSKELLTINTHRGLYRYNRLPFGVKSAPGIFQQIMDTMLAGLKGTVAYLDDVVVVGTTKEEHQKNLDAVLNRIAEFGFTIRPEKCSFGMNQIKYLGFVFDQSGRRPDPAKIEAIKSMPAPKDTTTLRSFLGMLSYYGSFVKEMREIRAPLDALLKKNSPFIWSSECQTAFDKSKALLNSDLLLTHYDPSLDIVIAADASEKGLGAVIMHRFPNGQEKAIAHASRALTPTEKGYSQIEKEALGLVFAVKKFHRMIHGRKFILLTDHQPLLSIFGSKKGIPVYTANRLHRWAVILLGYNFSIQYRSSNHFGCADALSRLISANVPPNEDAVIASVDADVRRVATDAIRALPVTAKQIKEETAKDELLKKIFHFLQNGWPHEISDKIKHFFNRRNSLSVVDGCLLSAERIVVPETLQRLVLRQLHRGHMGMVRMKALARSHVYWPGLDAQIEDLVRRCPQCALTAKLPLKHTLCPWPIPTKPWSRLHVDYAGPFQGHYFLVVVDALTKWPEILMTNTVTTTSTLVMLTELFSRFGLPDTLVTDNGTQFRSAEFKDFCQRNGIEHVFSPPYHPQSNGQAERFVDTFKRSLLKMKAEGSISEILSTFLLRYRSSPNPSIEGCCSPAEIMFGRKIKTDLTLLHPTAVVNVPNDGKMAKYFNRHHGSRTRTFFPGDPVYARRIIGNKTVWEEGVVLCRRGRVVYEIRVGQQHWTCHANHLKPRRKEIHNRTALNTLLDTFDIQYPSGKPASESTNMAEETTTTSATSPRPKRTIRPKRRLELEPRSKSYRYVYNSQHGGGVT